MIENRKNLLSIKEVAEILGLSSVTVSKKLREYSFKWIVRDKSRIMIQASEIPRLKELLGYNENFDKAKYYSTPEVAKIISGELKQIKRTNINNWLKNGRYNVSPKYKK